MRERERERERERRKGVRAGAFTSPPTCLTPLPPFPTLTQAAGKLAFINLLPNYPSPTQLNATDYGHYLEQYV
jgi:hypothetical protein